MEPKVFLQSIYQIEISKQSDFPNTQKGFAVSDKYTVGSNEMGKNNFRRIRSEITLKTTNNFPFTYK
jgi:hypothetical protein